MSNIVIINNDFKSYQLLPLEFNLSGKYTEIGICMAYNNKLSRIVGFKSIEEVSAAIKELLDSKINLSGIIYTNKPDNDYDENSYSPLLINEDYAVAIAGNSLDTFHYKKSNTKIFVDSSLSSIAKEAPDIFKTKPFEWMIRKILRPYVAGVILHKSGEIILIRKELYKDYHGFMHTCFETNKTRHLNANAKKNTTTSTYTYPNHKSKKTDVKVGANFGPIHIT